jgi:hypothetical protein
MTIPAPGLASSGRPSENENPAAAAPRATETTQLAPGSERTATSAAPVPTRSSETRDLTATTSLASEAAWRALDIKRTVMETVSAAETPL